jgi:anti-anti-sigma regulatory factor
MIGDPRVPVIRHRLARNGALDLDELIGPGGHGRSAVLSVADVPFLDTQCIGWLMAAHRRVAEAGGRLVLHSVPLRAQEALEFLSLERVLHIAKDEAAAVALVGEDAPSLSVG